MTRNFDILRAFVLVGLFLFVGRALGAVREIVLASKFGADETMDAYLFMLNLANWPVAVWFSALTVVAVPFLVRERLASPHDAQQFAFELSIVSLVAGSLLATMYWICVPLLAGSQSIGLSAKAGATVKDTVAVMSLLVPLGMLVGALSVKFLAGQRHTNTLFEGIPALVVAGATLSFISPDPTVLVWGTVFGSLAQTAALIAFLPREGGAERVRLQLRSPMWRPFLRAFVVVALCQCITSSTVVVDQFMIASLSIGSIAVFGFANRILSLFLGLGATAVSRATLPAFSSLSGKDNSENEMLAAARFWMKWLFAIGVICALFGWVSAPWIVQILFERGMFGPDDTAAVSVVLRFGLLQLPFYLSGIVAVQALAVRGRYDRIAQVGLANFAVKVGANLLLIDAFGVAGAMLATAAMYATAFPLLIMFAFGGRSVESPSSNLGISHATGVDN